MGSKTVLLEQCQVAPNGWPAEKLLPLLDFDLIFLRSAVVQLVFFYDFQCSKFDFLEEIVPDLKNSLSIALKHYSPLAGNTILPLTLGNPVSHYVAGDSVSLTIAQSDADFANLTGNHYRDADYFCDFVPKLPPATYLPDSIRFRLSAFQATLFLNQGICIGVTIHHSIADGATLLRFLQAWSSISKFKGDSHLLASAKKRLPFYDRHSINNARTTWNTTKRSRRMVNLATVTPPTQNVRATFVLTHTNIQHLKKKFIPNKNVSSFVIICAYLWTCFAKSFEPDEVADDEPQYLACPGDCRARLDPPLPDTYFGNCVAYMMAKSTHGRLRVKEGIVEAALAIGKAIQKTFPGKKGVDFSGYQEFIKLNRKRVFIIAGSPRYDVDGIDFGWGRSRKTEFIHIDSKESVQVISKSVDFEGVQIGLSMSMVEMDAFAAVFEHGIKESSQDENVFRSRI